MCPASFHVTSPKLLQLKITHGLYHISHSFLYEKKYNMSSNISLIFLKDEQYLSANATFVEKHVRKKTVINTCPRWG
jgi:hypothetical protein